VSLILHYVPVPLIASLTHLFVFAIQTFSQVSNSPAFISSIQSLARTHVDERRILFYKKLKCHSSANNSRYSQ